MRVTCNRNIRYSDQRFATENVCPSSIVSGRSSFVAAVAALFRPIECYRTVARDAYYSMLCYDAYQYRAASEAARSLTLRLLQSAN